MAFALSRRNIILPDAPRNARAAASRFSASARCLSRAGGFARPIATSGSVRASDGPLSFPRAPSWIRWCATRRVSTALGVPRGPPRAAVVRAAVLLGRKTAVSGDALPTTTRAVVFDAHGHPSRALRVDEAFPVAPLGPEDVLVGFAASPEDNPSDANVVEGTFATNFDAQLCPPGASRGLADIACAWRARRPAEPGGRGRPRRVRAGRRSAKTGEGCPRRPRLAGLVSVSSVFPAAACGASPRVCLTSSRRRCA